MSRQALEGVDGDGESGDVDAERCFEADQRSQAEPLQRAECFGEKDVVERVPYRELGFKELLALQTVHCAGPEGAHVAVQESGVWSEEEDIDADNKGRQQRGC